MPGMKATMEEFKEGKLHSTSKKGPIVTSRAQAIAIGLNERRRAGEDIPKQAQKSAIRKARGGY